MVGLVLAGCAGVSKQAFRAPQNHTIKNIAVMNVPQVSQYVAADFANPMLAFGAIGGAIVGAGIADKTTIMNKQLADDGFDFGKEMEGALLKQLADGGFAAEPVATSRKVAQGSMRLLDDYAAVKASTADAYLDVAPLSVGYGTFHPIFEPDWRPYIQLQVRLVSAKDKEVLYSDQITYGYNNPLLSDRVILPPKEAYYGNFDGLMSAKQQVTQNLRVAVSAVAQHIVSQFRDASGQVAAAKAVDAPKSEVLKPVEPPRAKEPESQQAKTSSIAAPAARTSTPATPNNSIEAPAPTRSAPVRTADFRQGASSYTVEQLARANGCTGYNGAKLVTEPGTLETYTVACDDGGHVEALCEYRQCKVTGRFR